MAIMKIREQPEPLEETQPYTSMPSKPTLVTDENQAQVKAEGDRMQLHRAWYIFKWPILLVLSCATMLAIGILVGSRQADDRADALLTAGQTSFDERLAELNASFESERLVLQAEIDQLEQQVESAPSAPELTRLQTELDQAKEELVQAEGVHQAEILELQRSNAGLRAHNDELTAQNQELSSEAAQARSARSRAETALTNELGQLPVRLSALTLPTSVAEYVFQGENTVVRESFGVHFFGWDDSTYAGKVGGFGFYDVSDEPVATEWVRHGERLRVEVGMPQLVKVGMFDFDENSLDNKSGWLSRLFNRGDIAEVLMHLEQQVLRPHACNDTSSLREYVNLIEAEFATQAKPYQVDVVWRGGDGQVYDVPSDAQLLGNAC